MTTPLLAEDLLLLLLDDESGKPTGWVDLQTVLGGAVLADLALAGLVEVEEKASVWRSAKVHAVGDRVPDDAVLAGALQTVAAKERSAQDLVGRLGKDLDDTLARRLADRGILEREDSRVLGIFSRTRWPAADTTREAVVRRALTAALAHGEEPDPHTRGLVALLHAVDQAHKVVDVDGVSKRDVKRRAKELAEGDWASKAVRDAIQASVAATTAAIAATTAATTATTATS
ncbi:GPP34 family phosphoprotein [Nocardioides sp. C4-1]|uniref:GOLPH3/VPS74 family protein n=1 Tax=Nocardioides sp. C4-1 TaxID=3151851 RepID=UPI00326448A7